MENQIEILRSLMEQKKYTQLRQAMQECNEVDLAAFISELPPTQAVTAFFLLNKEQAAQVFANLEGDTPEILITAMGERQLREIVEELNVDDAVDILEELPANMVKRVLKSATPDTRALLNQYMQYPENSAGTIMTAEYIDLRQNMAVSEAIARIRKIGDDSEQIYTCYVVNDSRELEGVVTVKELLLASDDRQVSDLMETNLITAVTTDDREDVSRQMMKYDLLSLPVVDLEKRLVGIVTVDDVMDVMEEEATEDFEKMAAMSPSERPYLKTGVFEQAKNRLGWLLILMISGMVNGGILGKYEAAFSAMPLLVTFIPMMTDTGGNAGSQSSTLVIRGMAVGEVTPRDIFRVLWMEFRVSLVVGVSLSAVNFLRLMIFYPGQTMLALTVALAMMATVVAAKTVGCLLPIVAEHFKVDPAIMASPLITTIVDAVALIIYFSIAQTLLGI